jgi:hypothetical protein
VPTPWKTPAAAGSFPAIGKIFHRFSNHWKKVSDFSNHWKIFFQSLEKKFPIIGKLFRRDGAGGGLN